MSTESANKTKLITILGPTGSGKSELAVELAQEFGGEIISADSRQIYKEMNIGTGKVSGQWVAKKENTSPDESADFHGPADAKALTGRPACHCEARAGRRENSLNQRYVYKGVEHHLIDFLSADLIFSVGQYKQAADEIIKRIVITPRHDSLHNNPNGLDQENKINLESHVSDTGDRLYSRHEFLAPLVPMLVGGTAQYVYAVIDNWQIPRVAANQKLRDKYEQLIQSSPNATESLWQELLDHDPEAASFVQKSNPRRIIRALEVIEATGQKFSSLRTKRPRQYEVLKLGIKISRNKLYQKIDQRVDEMLAQGLENEVRALVAKHGATAAGLQTIGYNEFLPYFAGQNTLAAVIQKIKFNSHRYVRHQSNWFNKDLDIHWINSQGQASDLIKNFLHGNNHIY